MNNILTLFIIISVLILLPGLQFAPKKDFFDNPFPLTVTKGMQGYLAFLVLFHQLSFQINTFIEVLKERNYEGLTISYEIIDGYDHNTVFKPSIKNTLLRFYSVEN